jgi:hypothetical protein
LRLSDEEIDSIKSGLKEDKLFDLGLEAVQLDAPEEEGAGGDAAGGDDLFGGGGGDDLFGGGDDAGAAEPAAAEPPAEEPAAAEEPGEPLAELKIDDEESPIRVANTIKKLTSLLSEDDEKKKTKAEEFQEEMEEKLKEKRRKRQTKKLTGTDELNIAGKNKGNKDDVTGMKRELTDLKRSYSYNNVNEHNLDEFDIDRYLDNKISQQGRMTGRIQSALRSLDDRKNSMPHVISENKNQGEDNDET